MYRAIFLILMLHVINSQQCLKIKKWEKKQPLWKQKQEMKQQNIGKQLLEVESSVGNMFCNENVIKNETYTQNEYILKYHVPGVSLWNVTMETTHRLLSARIGVTEKAEGRSVVKYLEDLHLLPVFVDISDGFWNVEDDVVVITFAYKNKCNIYNLNWPVDEVPSNAIEYYSMAIENSMLR